MQMADVPGDSKKESPATRPWTTARSNPFKLHDLATVGSDRLKRHNPAERADALHV